MRSLLISCLALSFAALTAQTPPTFEIASVKPNKSGTTQANVGMPPNGVNFVKLPLRGIIQLIQPSGSNSDSSSSRSGIRRKS